MNLWTRSTRWQFFEMYYSYKKILLLTTLNSNFPNIGKKGTFEHGPKYLTLSKIENCPKCFELANWLGIWSTKHLLGTHVTIIILLVLTFFRRLLKWSIFLGCVSKFLRFCSLLIVKISLNRLLFTSNWSIGTKTYFGWPMFMFLFFLGN